MPLLSYPRHSFKTLIIARFMKGKGPSPGGVWFWGLRLSVPLWGSDTPRRARYGLAHTRALMVNASDILNACLFQSIHPDRVQKTAWAGLWHECRGARFVRHLGALIQALNRKQKSAAY